MGRDDFESARTRGGWGAPAARDTEAFRATASSLRRAFPAAPADEPRFGELLDRLDGWGR